MWKSYYEAFLSAYFFFPYMLSRQSVTKRKINKVRRNYQQPEGFFNVDYTSVMLYLIKSHVKKLQKYNVQNIVKNEEMYPQT